MFNEIYNKILLEEFNNKKYINQNIGIYAGSFRIPYKEDIQIINQLLQSCNKVIIQISNVSQKNILNRPLSKTNLLSLSKFLDDNNLNSQQIIQLKNNIQNYTFKQICQVLKKEKCDKSIEFINQMQKKLFSTIQYYGEKQLTPQLIKQIFEILISDNRIQYVISKKPSPIIDTIDYVNQNCFNCNIKLISISDINSDMTTWQQLLNYFQQDNNIEQYFPKYKKILNRQDIIKQILKDNGLKYYTNNEEYNKIKEVLNG